MDLFNIIVTIVGGIFALVLGLFSGRRLNQEKLVATLKTLVETQEKRIQQLEDQLEDQTKEIGTLREKVEELSAVTIDQAIKLRDMKLNKGVSQ